MCVCVCVCVCVLCECVSCVLRSIVLVNCYPNSNVAHCVKLIQCHVDQTRLGGQSHGSCGFEQRTIITGKLTRAPYTCTHM